MVPQFESLIPSPPLRTRETHKSVHSETTWSARGGSRTHTSSTGQGILSPQRLPFRHPGPAVRFTLARTPTMESRTVTGIVTGGHGAKHTLQDCLGQFQKPFSCSSRRPSLLQCFAPPLAAHPGI